jgi:hypothetical protein
MEATKDDYIVSRSELTHWNDKDKTKLQLAFETRKFPLGNTVLLVDIWEFDPNKENGDPITIFKGDLSTLISILKKCNL